LQIIVDARLLFHPVEGAESLMHRIESNGRSSFDQYMQDQLFSSMHVKTVEGYSVVSIWDRGTTKITGDVLGAAQRIKALRPDQQDAAWKPRAMPEITNASSAAVLMISLPNCGSRVPEGAIPS
jgi:hypothetical protein